MERGKIVQRGAAREPDEEENMYNYDPSESEDEFGKAEKILIDNRRGMKQEAQEEEVFGIYSSSEEDQDDTYYGGGVGSDMDSDIEDGEKDNEDGLPDSKAWGKHSKSYYNTDYVDKDYSGLSKEDEELADMEEEEAAEIQKRLMSHMEQTDFTLGLLDQVEEKKNELSKRGEDGLMSEETIAKDLSKLSSSEKIQLLKRESPELFQLINDFNENMSLAQIKLLPLIKYTKQNIIKSSPATDFVHTLFTVIINYGTNIVFYLLLKSKRTGSVDNHPVINRLYTYKKIMDEMLIALEDKLMSQIDAILVQCSQNERLESTAEQTSTQPQPKNRAERRKRQLKILEEMKRTEKLVEKKKLKLQASKGQEPMEQQILSDLEDDDIADGLQFQEEDEAEEDRREKDEEGKRGITYEMKKNKGLTPRRKKEDRNPRVKNRNKYKNAIKRRKGQVRKTRTETSRYGGELSGVKSYLTKSVKIKV